MRRTTVLLMIVELIPLLFTTCINLPGDTSQIKLLATSTSIGWTHQ